MTLNEHLTAVADAIRTKEGSTAKITPADFPSKILSLQTVTGDIAGSLFETSISGGTVKREVTVTFDDLKEIKYVMVMGMYKSINDNNYYNLHGTYADGEVRTNSTYSTISVSGNSFTFTTSHATTSDTTTLYGVVAGVAA